MLVSFNAVVCTVQTGLGLQHKSGLAYISGSGSMGNVLTGLLGYGATTLYVRGKVLRVFKYWSIALSHFGDEILVSWFSMIPL